MIKCSELIGKSTISNYYEFLFCMALAAECGRRGRKLDMTDMRLFDKGMLSADDIAYLHYLKGIGCIEDGSAPKAEEGAEDETHSHPKLWFGVNAVTDLYDVLLEDTPNGYLWSRKYAFNTYGEYKDSLLSVKNTGNTVMHLAAHYFICFKLGDRPIKPVTFYYAGFEVATASMYMDLYACCQLPYMEGFEVTFDEGYREKMGDLDFNILYSTALHSGRLKKWEYSKKFEVFRNFGWGVGSILVLYKRSKVSSSNPVGTITGASIIRIDKVNSELNSNKGRVSTGWEVTEFAVEKTKEEIELDYLGIKEDIRYLFSDLLNTKLNGVSTLLPFDMVGVSSYFLDEEFIMMPLEKSGRVSKLVTVDGKKVPVEMSEIDAVYWILRQYGVEFDFEKYKADYNGGEPLMWDSCDPTPLLTATYEVGKYTEDGGVIVNLPEDESDSTEDEAYDYANYVDDDDEE